jgi:hypothetical protein
MGRRATAAFGSGVVALLVVAAAWAAGGTKTWSFDAGQAGGPPAGFELGRTGSGPSGRWVVKAVPDAPSGPNVLAQIDADDTDYRFPVAVVREPAPRDLRLAVKCKMVSGKVDQACGLVWRYRDERNYYVARANALENNVRLYYVKNGRRKQLASWSGTVTGNAWHELRAEAQGARLMIFWDGQKIVDAHDKTFSEGGQVGVWTKADSVTYFDDLTWQPP